MKVLVTGCAGFIGSNLVPALLSKGHEVVGLDNMSNPSLNYASEYIDPYKTDITDEIGLCSILDHEKPDAVVHLAAVGSVPRSFMDPARTVKNNELGFATLLHSMARTNVRRLVFASSSSVYGDNSKRVKCEGEEGKPLSPYALSKKMNEEFAKIYAPRVGIKYVGLRFFNVYGPGQLMNSPYSAVIPKFINQETPIIFGDGKTERDFTYVGDVIEAIHQALDHTDKYASNIYNVGYGFGVTLNEVVSMLGKVSQYQGERPGDIKRSVAGTDFAELGLGFRAKIPISIGLELTRKYYEGLNHVGNEEKNA